MSRTARRAILIASVALVGFLLVAKLRYSGRAPVTLPAADCNSDLWKRTYSPERLRVIEACTAVEGRVVSVHPAADGDLHIGLDPDHASVLNLVNVVHQRRRLVVEIVCEHTPTGKGPGAICAGYISQVSIPKVGDRVRVTGAYVTDGDYGWTEIHPVTRIDVLP